MPCNVVVLISGSGSNLQALIDSQSDSNPARIGAVISNRADAYGLQRAQAAGIPTQVLSHREFAVYGNTTVVIGFKHKFINYCIKTHAFTIPVNITATHYIGSFFLCQPLYMLFATQFRNSIIRFWI